MALNSYVQGQSVRIYLRFKNAQGVPADPTTVTLKVETPAGVTTTYTYAGGHLTKPETGVYYYDIDTTTAAGVWHYRGIGTGAVVAAGQDKFTVVAARPA